MEVWEEEKESQEAGFVHLNHSSVVRYGSVEFEEGARVVNINTGFVSL